MKIERWTNADGLPCVRWQQDVPSGESVHTRAHKNMVRFGALAGLFAFGAVLGSGGELSSAALAGVGLLALIGFPDAFRGINLNVGGSAVAAGEKSEALRQSEARGRLMAVYRTEFCTAELHRNPVKGLELFITRGTREHPDGLVANLPFDQFQELELATWDEWFGDAAGRELARMDNRPQVWVIVMPATPVGVVLVACSGRDKAGMAELHQVLRTEFIARRPALLAAEKGRKLQEGSRRPAETLKPEAFSRPETL